MILRRATAESKAHCIRVIAQLFHELAADQSWSACRRGLARGAAVVLDRLARVAENDCESCEELVGQAMSDAAAAAMGQHRLVERFGSAR